MNRREFVKKTLGSFVLANASGSLVQLNAQSNPKITSTHLNELKSPLAIAMWDFSWLLRHYQGGGFEDWDIVLDQLVERGYNAIRIDCFPHLVAAGKNGQIKEEFYFPKKDWKPVSWGNGASIYAKVRRGLLEFIPKCHERGIYISLSTWFRTDDSHRNHQVKSLAEFVRVWKETLDFLNEHGLLKNVIFVDILNEYPFWHGFSWLHNEIKKRGAQNEQDINDKDENEKHLQNFNTSKYNNAQINFYRDFATDTIEQLKGSYPLLDYTASLSYHGQVDWQDMDFNQLDLIDMHIWFIHNGKLSNPTGFWNMKKENDLKFRQVNAAIKKVWRESKPEFINWMDAELRKIALAGKKYNIPYGCTEGWGPLGWLEHPNLDWDWVKETGEIAVKLAKKHDYSFICTSNYNQPQFPGVWNDIKWHQKLTSIIKQA